MRAPRGVAIDEVETLATFFIARRYFSGLARSNDSQDAVFESGAKVVTA